MIDREKVINELVSHIENALSVDSDYVDCIPTDLLQYAVALLKAQEVAKDTEYNPWKNFIQAVAEETPDPCKNCSNHPSNGGSGICNCTLGLPKVTV